MTLPDMIPLGWAHTIIAIAAIISGIYCIYRYKILSSKTTSGQFYLIATLITAVTALMIYQHGKFGIAHGLAVLTLLAIAGGLICERTNIFRKFSPYLQAMSYSGTLMFHMVPAVTDATLRLPPGNPMLDSIESPVLLGLYLLILVAFLVGTGLQFIWLSKQS